MRMNKGNVMSELRRGLDLTLPFFTWEPGMLAKSYGPGKWTAQQVLGHLADCEIVFQVRARLILSEPGAAITPFDQDRWCRTLLYNRRSMALSRRLFNAARDSLIELVDLLPEEIFGREGRHPQHPSYRAWDVATRAASHNFHHLGQLEAIRDGTAWAAPAP